MIGVQVHAVSHSLESHLLHNNMWSVTPQKCYDKQDGFIRSQGHWLRIKISQYCLLSFFIECSVLVYYLQSAGTCVPEPTTKYFFLTFFTDYLFYTGAFSSYVQYCIHSYCTYIILLCILYSVLYSWDVAINTTKKSTIMGGEHQGIATK